MHDLVIPPHFLQALREEALKEAEQTAILEEKRAAQFISRGRAAACELLTEEESVRHSLIDSSREENRRQCRALETEGYRAFYRQGMEGLTAALARELEKRRSNGEYTRWFGRALEHARRLAGPARCVCTLVRDRDLIPPEVKWHPFPSESLGGFTYYGEEGTVLDYRFETRLEGLGPRELVGSLLRG